MSIESRLARVEQLLGHDEEDALEGIPEAWLELDPITGGYVGPPEGTAMSRGQENVWETVTDMDASIPSQ